MSKAWHVIRANASKSSSPWVRDDVQGFGADEQRNIRSISTRIQRESYRFGKSRGVAIPKKPGSLAIRPIVLSKVEDRVVQRCMLDALVNCSDLRAFAFQPNSFGGIPKAHHDPLAGVPAAIARLLEFAAAGCTHVIVADIEGFFTRISKSHATKLIERFVSDRKFLRLIDQAIAVDLENLHRLWRFKDQFPRDDLGVAQGNCLSPFIGNLVLAEFDQIMNEGDCHCLRYIDDVIILAPNGRAASARLRKAKSYLADLGMKFSDQKSALVPSQISGSFNYLGIEFRNGCLRPSRQSCQSIVERVEGIIAESLRMMAHCVDSDAFNPNLSLPKVLNRVAGMVRGWTYHYKFCNDLSAIMTVDDTINSAFLDYLKQARWIASTKRKSVSAALLGYRGAAAVEFEPFQWPLPRPAPPESKGVLTFA